MTINKIKKAALRNFIEKGYEGTSLFHIAEEAGIKKQSIYSHFKNKDELFLTIMNQVISEETEFFHQFLEQSNLELKNRLKNFIFEFKKRYIQSGSSNIQFVLRMTYMPPNHLKEEVVRSFNYFFLELEGLVNGLFLKDADTQTKASNATLSFMTLLDGLLVALTYGSSERFDKKFEASWDIFWIGLLNC